MSAIAFLFGSLAIFKDAVFIMPCAHNFCQGCIRQEMTTCPVCRTPMDDTPSTPNVFIRKKVDDFLRGNTDVRCSCCPARMKYEEL